MQLFFFYLHLLLLHLLLITLYFKQNKKLAIFFSNNKRSHDKRLMFNKGQESRTSLSFKLKFSKRIDSTNETRNFFAGWFEDDK